MKSGFGIAAFARWRALHEVIVTAAFLREHGKNAAQIYLEYESVQAYQAMQEYAKHEKILGGALWRKAEKKKLQRRYYYLIKKYTKNFQNPYGWAKVYAAHYRKRADEGVITRQQAEQMIGTLERLKTIRPQSLVEMQHQVLNQETYYWS